MTPLRLTAHKPKILCNLFKIVKPIGNSNGLFPSAPPAPASPRRTTGAGAPPARRRGLQPGGTPGRRSGRGDEERRDKAVIAVVQGTPAAGGCLHLLQIGSTNRPRV